MVMSHPAATALPVTLEEHRSLITCRNPASTRVRWPSPVSLVPSVTVFVRIPIPLNPHELRFWRWYWSNVHHARGRGRTNVDSDRNLRLSPDDRSADQQECSNERHPYQTFHALNPATANSQHPVHTWSSVNPLPDRRVWPYGRTSTDLVVSNMKCGDRKRDHGGDASRNDRWLPSTHALTAAPPFVHSIRGHFSL
jgi:hypothetical protein